jgi:hypothetical protein
VLASDWIFYPLSCRAHCPQSVFAWRDISKSHVMSALIVFDPPGLDKSTRFGQRFEQMDVETFVAQGPIERLNEGVVPPGPFAVRR